MFKRADQGPDINAVSSEVCRQFALGTTAQCAVAVR